jgi:probable phosphoglycerate mutase
MAHGGVIHAALSRGLGFAGERPWPISRILNTAVTEVVASDGGFHLQILNDARHAPTVTGHDGDSAVPVALARHGESQANVEGRWHGRTDGPLTRRGANQGAALAESLLGITKVFASPLERTRITAAGFAGASGLKVEVIDDLIEIDFGAWEGLTTSEIEERFPEEFDRIFLGAEDLPRGGTGETFAGAGARLESAVAQLVRDHPNDSIAAFTHGGAIWALASRLLGIDWSGWRKLAIPSNASTTHVRFDGTTPILIDYNLPL